MEIALIILALHFARILAMVFRFQEDLLQLLRPHMNRYHGRSLLTVIFSIAFSKELNKM